MASGLSIRPQQQQQQTGEESVTGDDDAYADVGVIPVIDLRWLCQDEIRNVARLSVEVEDCGDGCSSSSTSTSSSDGRRRKRRRKGTGSGRHEEEGVNSAIDKSIFNESAGSRRQTYDRERSYKRRENGRNSVSSTTNKSILENHHLILLLCRRLHIDERRLPPPLPLLNPPAPSPSSQQQDREETQSCGPSLQKAQCVPRPQSSSKSGRSVARTRSRRRSKSGKTRPKRLKRRARVSTSAGGGERDADAAAAANNDRLVRSSRPAGASSRTRKILKSKRATKKSMTNNAAADRSKGLGGKVFVEPEGFPDGWRACVHLKRRGTKTSTEIMNFISPEGQEWYSYTEALAHAGSIMGSHHEKNSLLCFTCGKRFAKLGTLERHANKEGHGPNHKAAGVASEAGYKDNTQKTLVNHHHENINQGSGVARFSSGQLKGYRKGAYACRYCHKRFRKNKCYIHHMNIHIRKGRIGKQVKAKEKDKVPAGASAKCSKQKKRKRKQHQECTKRRVVVKYNCALDTSVACERADLGNAKDLSELGFRRLLSGTTGTYFSGLPAKLLFSK